MIQFSAEVLTYSREVAYSRQDAYFFFDKQPNVQNKTLIKKKKTCTYPEIYF